MSNRSIFLTIILLLFVWIVYHYTKNNPTAEKVEKTIEQKAEGPSATKDKNDKEHKDVKHEEVKSKEAAAILPVEKSSVEDSISAKEAKEEVKAVDVTVMPALVVAAEKNDLDAVKKLLKDGADVNAQTSQGTTALAAAVRNKNLDLVKFLLENGADKNLSECFHKVAVGTKPNAGGAVIGDVLVKCTPENTLRKTPLVQANEMKLADIAQFIQAYKADGVKNDKDAANGYKKADVAKNNNATKANDKDKPAVVENTKSIR